MSESKLLAAIGALLPYAHQPNSDEFKKAMVEVRAAYTSSLHDNALRPHDGLARTAPIKMQCAMQNFSPEELIDIKTFIEKKLEPYNAAQKAKAAEQMRQYATLSQNAWSQELMKEMAKTDAYAAKIDHYANRIKLMNLPTGTAVQVTDSDMGKLLIGSAPKKRPWWKPFK